MKKYVVTFLFKPSLDAVWLIEKQKPEWQKGHLNGIGGKIEPGEEPIEAAVRELKEEAGVSLFENSLTLFGDMKGINNDGEDFQVFIFSGTTDAKLETKEEEFVLLVVLKYLKGYPLIENVPFLIERLPICPYWKIKI